MVEFVKCRDSKCRYKGRHAHPRRFTFDGPLGQQAIKKAAWACCEVNDCGGTKKQPCTKHMGAAKKMFRDIAEIWE